MKKEVMIILVVMVSIFLVSCIDYKAYDIQEKENTEDIDLLEEIAQIEEELLLQEESLDGEEEVVEEIILPDLGEPKLASEEIQILTVDENELIKINLRINDPDQDEVTYTFTLPLNDQGIWQTSYGDAGEYLVTIKATDGKLTTEKPLKIVVNRVNVPPVIEKIQDMLIKEGETVTFSPKVNDPNNDPVEVRISEPLKSGTFLTDYTSAGEYLIIIESSDGELTAEESFRLIVEDVNMLPELNNLKDLVVNEGELVELSPEVTDLDGDEVTLTFSGPVDENGLWETSFTDHGDYIIIVTADDGKEAVTKKVQVTVNDVNMPPEIVEVYLDLN